MDRSESNANFMALTNTGPQEAEFYLGAANYDLDRAVQMYFEQQPAGQQPASLQHRVVAAPVQHAVPAPQPVARRRRQRQGFLQELLHIPVMLVNAGAQIIYNIFNLGFTLTTSVGSRVLPQSIQRNLQGIARSLSDGNRLEDASQSATSFKQMFQQQYGPTCPDFVETSWEEATAQAHRQFKFLMVYLHAAEHQDTDQFCRQTLCNPELVLYVNSTLVCWGGDIRKSNPYKLATSSGLRVTQYPYIALLSGSSSRTKMVASAEGLTSATDLLHLLQPAVEEHGAQFVADRADHDERLLQELNRQTPEEHHTCTGELNRRLREEQDDEYQRSLLADQEREQKRNADRAAEQAKQQAAQEALDAERLEKETAEKRKLDAATLLQQRKANKKRSLAPEPAPGTAGTATIRVRLPDGSSAQRRFLADQPLQVVYDFVDSLDGLTSLKYSLATTFPKVIYGTEKLQLSLSQLNLAPQAAMLVQPQDDD